MLVEIILSKKKMRFSCNEKYLPKYEKKQVIVVLACKMTLDNIQMLEVNCRKMQE